MDHCNESENVIMHSILCVKLEPFDEDEDCTQNLDPLQPDSNINTQMELLHDFKTEIQSDGSDQAIGDTETKIEEINIKTEYIDNEASLDEVLDSRGIIEDDTSGHSQLSEKDSSTNTGEKNTTRYDLSHFCQPQYSDVINEKSTNDGSSFNVTSLANHSRASPNTCTSGVDVLGTHSTSEEEGSEQSSSFIAHSVFHQSYVSNACDLKFKNSHNLVSHKVAHTNQKPHVCDVCNKGFSYPCDLVKHKRIHTGEKPYLCDICKKGFGSSSYLLIHKRIHTCQKPYVCDICKKGFSNSSALVTHKRVHTGQKPYVCDICEKGFTVSSALVKHKRIHTGQKPYVCDVCKKGFSQSSDLVKHRRIHTGQKPYVCDICQKGFTSSSNLAAHKRTHIDQKSCA